MQHKKDQTTSPGKRGVLVERNFKDERNWKILDEVIAVADEVKRPPVQVALNWLSQKPGVTSSLVGARTVDQLKENIAALDFKLTPHQMARLDHVRLPVSNTFSSFLLLSPSPVHTSGRASLTR
jgi:aryl-alcohol dehydrogenase-like predicted oxidoreductase